MKHQKWNQTLIITLTLLLITTNTTLSTTIPIQRTPTNRQPTPQTTEIDNLITFYMKIGHIPSLSTCIIKNTTVVWTQAYGISDIKNQKEATPATIYLAGSISKSITATALLQLYEQGKFNLDDDVNNYLPFSLRNPNYPEEPITIRMLLAHQSSLKETYKSLLHFFLIDYPYSWLPEYLTPNGSIYNPNTWSTTYAPGEDFYYANLGFELLGYIFEQLSNQTLENYCQDHIFTPLNMTNTSFHVTSYAFQNLAVPYVWRLGRFIPFPHYDIGMTAAGGLRTNALDLSKFLIAHMNNGTYQNTSLLNQTTIQLMHTIQYPNNTDNTIKYGLGWAIIQDNTNTTIQGHSGGVFGGTAYMFYRTQDKTGVTYLLNKNRIFQLRPHILETFALRQIQKALYNHANTYN